MTEEQSPERPEENELDTLEQSLKELEAEIEAQKAFQEEQKNKLVQEIADMVEGNRGLRKQVIEGRPTMLKEYREKAQAITQEKENEIKLEGGKLNALEERFAALKPSSTSEKAKEIEERLLDLEGKLQKKKDALEQIKEDSRRNLEEYEQRFAAADEMNKEIVKDDVGWSMQQVLEAHREFGGEDFGAYASELPDLVKKELELRPKRREEENRIEKYNIELDAFEKKLSEASEELKALQAEAEEVFTNLEKELRSSDLLKEVEDLKAAQKKKESARFSREKAKEQAKEIQTTLQEKRKDLIRGTEKLRDKQYAFQNTYFREKSPKCVKFFYPAYKQSFREDLIGDMVTQYNNRVELLEKRFEDFSGEVEKFEKDLNRRYREVTNQVSEIFD